MLIYSYFNIFTDVKMDNSIWHYRFLELAKNISSWSKDPSTKVGAVIFDSDKRIVSVGYNGFPKNISDDPEKYLNREIKYQMVIHAEINAILFAKRDLNNCSIATWPFISCSNCTSAIIQAGIKKIVSPKLPENLIERWGKSCDLSIEMYKQANVEIVLL
jgi:dCMP deaminase